MSNLDDGLLGKFSGLIEARKLIKTFLKDNKDVQNYDQIMQVSNEIKNIINTGVVVEKQFQTSKRIRVIAHKHKENNFFLCRGFIKSMGTMKYTYYGDFDEQNIIILDDDEFTIDDVKYHFPIGVNPNDFKIVTLDIKKDIKVIDK